MLLLTKRNFLFICTLFIIILIPTIYYRVYLPQTVKTHVVFVHPVPLVEGFWEWDYADYAGIYQEEGLNVTTLIVRTTPEMIQAMVAGEADFTGAIQTSIEAIAAGNPLKIVLATQRLSYAIDVRSEINSINDVKSVAIHSRNIATLLVNNYFLAHGISPTDITYRYVGGPGLLPAILGPATSPTACDAANLGASTYNALQAGCKILTPFFTEYPNFLMDGLATTEKMITEKPEIVKSMVKATYRSLAFIMTHKEEAITYAMQRFNIDRAYATFIYEWSYGDEYGQQHLKLEEIGLPTAMLNYTMQLCAQWHEVDPQPLETWIQTSFWEQAKRELGLS